MKIILTHIQGSCAGSKTECENPIMRIGRDPKLCDLAFNSFEEPGVSRIHAIITFSEGNFYVEDNGSRNGTYVDAVQIQGKTLLNQGSFIQFGVEGPIVRFDFDLKHKPKAPSTRAAAKVEPPKSTLLDNSPKVICPVCETECLTTAKFCRRCGTPMLPNIDLAIYENADPEITLAPLSKEEREAQERRRIIAAAAASPVFRACAVCGSRLSGEPKFCSACGALIHPDSAGLPPLEDKSLVPQPAATAYVPMNKLVDEPNNSNKVRKPKTKPNNPTISDLESSIIPEVMAVSTALPPKPLKKIPEQPLTEISKPPKQTPSSTSIPLSIENKTQNKTQNAPLYKEPSASQLLNKTFSPGYTLLLSAQALAKEGRNKLALDECERALRLDPHLPEVYQFMGKTLLSMKENEKAVEAFEKALELHPSFGEIYADLSQAYLRSGRNQDAVKSGKEAIKMDQTNASAYYTMGLALMEIGDYANAFEGFMRAVKLKTDYAEAYLGLANIQLRGGRADDAIISCKEAIKYRPDYFQAYCLLGQTYRAKKQMIDAQQALKQAIKIKPDYSIAYNYLALNHRSQGNLDEAEAACYKAIALDPNLPENHNTMGLLHGERSEYTEAILEYKKALELRPNYAEAYNNLGLCYFKTNDFTKAVEYFEKAVALEPQFVLARVNLALCYFKKQDKENVKKQYDILYELDESRAAKLYQKIKPLLKS